MWCYPFFAQLPLSYSHTAILVFRFYNKIRALAYHVPGQTRLVHLFFLLSHPFIVRRTPRVLRPLAALAWYPTPCPIDKILVLCMVFAGLEST
jgi:hypothetical protein